MKKIGFELYQYLAPAILTPVSFGLWWHTYQGNLRLTLMAWLLPILYAYIVPGIGTNVLKVWEFNTQLRLGRFRPHHGFVFGSATSTLVWICHGHTIAQTWGDLARFSFVTASILGFWNLLYDIKAIKAGILKVYNQPMADQKDAEVIACDYAPWFFAGFGAIYGAGLGLAELITSTLNMSNSAFAVYFLLILILAMTLPVLGYRRQSFARHGHSGCRPVQRNEHVG